MILQKSFLYADLLKHFFLFLLMFKKQLLKTCGTCDIQDSLMNKKYKLKKNKTAFLFIYLQNSFFNVMLNTELNN